MIQQLKNNALREIEAAKDIKGLDIVYRKYLGRQKGELTKILRSLRGLSEKERREMGKAANQLKIKIEETFRIKTRQLKAEKPILNRERIDVTAPGLPAPLGHLHPITLVQRQIEEIFQSMGFSVVSGPEIETEYYNFDVLNVPQNHPARDVFDTFWLKPTTNRQHPTTNALQLLTVNTQQPTGKAKFLLRTHTSPVQARYMEKHNPPLRIIAPGRCFRHEATDASHESTFHQVEGLMIGQDINLANLKGILEEFMKRFYGQGVKLKWQPSYFPFVEPGLELLMGCRVCGGKGCSTCGQSGWLEVIPCGMVHPNVLKAVKYNPRQWQGFAFGMGLDRIVMMKYQIDDIRLLYSGDLRFLKQF